MVRCPAVGRAVALALLAVLLTAATGCVGSGKTARAEVIEPLPAGITVVHDVSMGCRDGESGFDYRYVIVGPTDDLSAGGPLLRSLRDRGFYHSIGLRDDLPWVTVGYQMSDYPLRAELGLLSGYLTDPVNRQGPPVDSIPLEVRNQADHYVLIAMRPTDFACTTPL